jgi:carboxypeptidase Taq
VIEWLNTKVHAVGNLYDPLDFIKKLTGEKLNPHYFLDYAEVKFGDIFQF